LCSTFARSASGVVRSPRLRNTAVRGTRWIGGSADRTDSRNADNEPSCRTRCAVTSARPRCQVVMIVNTIKPIAGGSHAPWINLVRFAAKNSTSMLRNIAPPPRTSQSGTCHR
jgi:hypothetical protein